MSRNIPQVKTWKVTFYYGNRVAVEYVDAPNKRFARWAAREQNYGCSITSPYVVRETVSVVRSSFGGPYIPLPTSGAR